MVTSGRFEEEYEAMAASPRRIRLRDVKPYACPDSLSDLQGPYSGVIRLPHTVRWVGEGMADLVRSVGSASHIKPCWRRGMPLIRSWGSTPASLSRCGHSSISIPG